MLQDDDLLDAAVKMSRLTHAGILSEALKPSSSSKEACTSALMKEGGFVIVRES